MTKKRILVVDDEPFIMRSLTYVLKGNRSFDPPCDIYFGLMRLWRPFC